MRIRFEFWRLAFTFECSFAWKRGVRSAEDALAAIRRGGGFQESDKKPAKARVRQVVVMDDRREWEIEQRQKREDEAARANKPVI